MLAGKCAHLFNLGRSDVARKDSADTTTFVMNFEHDSRRLFSIERKKTLKNGNDEIHRREIVVQQHHLVHFRRLRLGALCLKQPVFLKLRSHAFDSKQFGPMCNREK